MRKVKDVEINGRRLTLNELTVAEILKLLDEGAPSLLNVMFDGRLPSGLVCASAGIEEDELREWPPSEIARLYDEVEKVNPHCARLCRNLARIAPAPEPGAGDPAPTTPVKSCAGPAVS